MSPIPDIPVDWVNVTDHSDAPPCRMLSAERERLARALAALAGLPDDPAAYAHVRHAVASGAGILRGELTPLDRRCGLRAYFDDGSRQRLRFRDTPEALAEAFEVFEARELVPQGFFDEPRRVFARPCSRCLAPDDAYASVLGWRLWQPPWDCAECEPDTTRNSRCATINEVGVQTIHAARGYTCAARPDLRGLVTCAVRWEELLRAEEHAAHNLMEARGQRVTRVVWRFVTEATYAQLARAAHLRYAVEDEVLPFVCARTYPRGGGAFDAELVGVAALGVNSGR